MNLRLKQGNSKPQQTFQNILNTSVNAVRQLITNSSEVARDYCNKNHLDLSKPSYNLVLFPTLFPSVQLCASCSFQRCTFFSYSLHSEKRRKALSDFCLEDHLSAAEHISVLLQACLCSIRLFCGDVWWHFSRVSVK